MSDGTLAAVSEAAPGGYREIGVQQALAHLSAFRCVDVREPDEYVGPLGHIQGAELVPLGTVLAEAGQWDREKPLLLICRSGARSGRAAGALRGLGFSQVFNLTGGMLAWDAAGYPRAER